MERRFDYLHLPNNLKLRYGIWPSEINHPRGSVLYLSGRAEFLEKNAESIDRLRMRGFDVYAFDWRGQGLSSRLLKNRHKGHVRDYEDYLADLDLFINRIFLPRAHALKICLAHSMGGHIALRYLHDHEGIFDKCALVAPMLDIHTWPLPYKLARLGVRAASRSGMMEAFVPGQGNYHPGQKRFLFNPLTGDPDRFSQEIREVRRNPDLAVGGVTYGWLAASFASIDIINLPGYADTIRTPVLMVSGNRDRVVKRAAQKRFSHRMPDCRFINVRGAKHEILKETDAVQKIFWKAFDAFVSS